MPKYDLKNAKILVTFKVVIKHGLLRQHKNTITDTVPISDALMFATGEWAKAKAAEFSKAVEYSYEHHLFVEADVLEVEMGKELPND